MVFPKAGKGVKELNRSMVNMLNATYQTRSAVSRLWYVAPTCPLFLKRGVTKKLANNARGYTLVPNKRCRANRVISNHTIKALASGAAATAAASAAAEAAALRCEINPESQKCPMSVSISKSAAMYAEAAYVAYLQEAFHNSVQLKKAFPKHKKVTQRCAQAGIDVLNERIAMATSFVPASIMARVPAPAKKAAAAAAAAAPEA